MTSGQTTPIRMLAGSLVLACLVGLVVVAAVYLFPALGMEKSFFWAAVVAGFGWLIKNGLEQRRDQQRLLADQKRQQYYELIDFVLKAFAANKTGNPLELERESFQRWSLRLALNGSDEVIRAWNAIRQQAAPDQRRSPAEVLAPWARLLLAMRRDCGHDNTRVTGIELWMLIVNDIDPRIPRSDRGG